jgi:hypothetical protein
VKVLKVGLLLDGARADKYVYELALWANGQPNIRISYLMLRRETSALGRLKTLLHPRRLHLFAAKVAFRLIVWAEKMLLRRAGPHKDHYRSHDLAGIVEHVVDMTPVVSPSGHVYRFTDEDIEKVKALDLDLLIRCGAGILRGNILRASRLGIVSFHHGDNRVNRGGPPGFWECYYRWPRTGFIIQRLTEELDGGDVLVRGFFATRCYYSLNQAHVCKKSLTHMKALLGKVASTGELPQTETGPAPYSSILFRAPNLVQCAVYACKLLTQLSANAIGRVVLPRERWGISVLPARWDKAALWRSTEVASPRGRFWADPFLFARHGKTFCFVEDFVYKERKAHISVLEISGASVIERGVALKEPFHLSFPFLFEYQGQLFMCPEAAQSGQVRVYRCTEFPLKWEVEKILMDGVSAADTVLFEKGGKWWMLTSIDESGTGDHCSELYLFSSDSPLSTTWAPHPQNPVRIDSWGGRNAGLVIEGERIFRLAQCQGFDRYGHSLLVHEIRDISESRYVEEPVASIGPAFRSGVLGTHHLSTDGRITVIDHVSRSFLYSRRPPKPSRRPVAGVHPARVGGTALPGPSASSRARAQS